MNGFSWLDYDFIIMKLISVLFWVTDPEFHLKNSLYFKNWRSGWGLRYIWFFFHTALYTCAVCTILSSECLCAQTHTQTNNIERAILSKLVCCQLATMLLHGFRHIFSTITKIALQLLPILQFQAKLFIRSSIKSHIKFNILYNVRIFTTFCWGFGLELRFHFILFLHAALRNVRFVMILTLCFFGKINHVNFWPWKYFLISKSFHGPGEQILLFITKIPFKCFYSIPFAMKNSINFT